MSDGLNREGFTGIEVTHDPEIPVHLVQLPLCDLCLDGAGGQCHVPGCALWIKSAPDIPIRDFVTVIDPAAEPKPAPELAAAIQDIIDRYPEQQPAPEFAAETRPRVDWARVSEAVAERERERDEARAGRDKYRELLDEIGVMAANAPEDGDSFGLLEQIAMRIAAIDVPDTTPIDEWPDPENPVTGRTPGAAAAPGDDGVSVDIGSPEDGDYDRCEPTL